MTDLETKLGLMCLQLIRQLPRDNRVRKRAEELVVEAGFCDLGHILRNDEIERLLSEVELGTRRCLVCDGPMHHERLRGWVCSSPGCFA